MDARAILAELTTTADRVKNYPNDHPQLIAEVQGLIARLTGTLPAPAAPAPDAPDAPSAPAAPAAPVAPPAAAPAAPAAPAGPSVEELLEARVAALKDELSAALKDGLDLIRVDFSTLRADVDVLKLAHPPAPAGSLPG